MSTASACQTVKFLNRKKLSAGISSMLKKFSKMLRGAHAAIEAGSHIKLLALTLYPSRINRPAQTARYSAFEEKNSAMFAHLGINPFMCA